MDLFCCVRLRQSSAGDISPNGPPNGPTVKSPLTRSRRNKQSSKKIASPAFTKPCREEMECWMCESAISALISSNERGSLHDCVENRRLHRMRGNCKESLWDPSPFFSEWLTSHELFIKCSYQSFNSLIYSKWKLNWHLNILGMEQKYINKKINLGDAHALGALARMVAP